MLVEYVKYNYYARFHTRSYHRCRATHFNARLGIPKGTNCAPLVVDLFYFAMKEI